MIPPLHLPYLRTLPQLALLPVTRASVVLNKLPRFGAVHALLSIAPTTPRVGADVKMTQNLLHTDTLRHPAPFCAINRMRDNLERELLLPPIGRQLLWCKPRVRFVHLSWHPLLLHAMMAVLARMLARIAQVKVRALCAPPPGTPLYFTPAFVAGRLPRRFFGIVHVVQQHHAGVLCAPEHVELVMVALLEG